METFLGVFIALLSRGAVHASPLAVVDSSLVDAVNGGLQLVVHRAAQDGVANVVAKVKGPNEQDVDARDSGDLIDLFGSQRSSNSPSQIQAHTFAKASLVSICAIVTKASFASIKYSTVLWLENLPIGKGEPKPRVPCGGNLADETSFRASSAV